MLISNTAIHTDTSKSRAARIARQSGGWAGEPSELRGLLDRKFEEVSQDFHTLIDAVNTTRVQLVKPGTGNFSRMPAKSFILWPHYSELSTMGK